MEYSIRDADDSDFVRISQIYNQAIEMGDITADLQPQTPEQRRDALGEHIANTKYPLVVLCDSKNPDTIFGYGYLSHYHDRVGYDISAEVSYYLDMNYRGQGLGGKILSYLMAYAQTQIFENLMAVTFGGNTRSNNLLEKNGFSCVAQLPGVAINENHEYLTQCIYCYRLPRFHGQK